MRSPPVAWALNFAMCGGKKKSMLSQVALLDTSTLLDDGITPRDVIFI